MPGTQWEQHLEERSPAATAGKELPMQESNPASFGKYLMTHFVVVVMRLLKKQGKTHSSIPGQRKSEKSSDFRFRENHMQMLFCPCPISPWDISSHLVTRAHILWVPAFVSRTAVLLGHDTFIPWGFPGAQGRLVPAPLSPGRWVCVLGVRCSVSRSNTSGHGLTEGRREAPPPHSLLLRPEPEGRSALS